MAGYAVSADRKSRAVLWQGGAIADLGALPGGSAGMAHAINNSGQVAGMAYTANSQLRAALWQGGTVADLGILPGGSGWDLLDATSINDAGQIVGHGRVGGQTEVHAYLLTPVGTPVPPSAGGGGRSVQPWGTSPLVALGLLALLTLLTCRHIASRRGGSTGPGAASRGEAP